MIMKAYLSIILATGFSFIATAQDADEPVDKDAPTEEEIQKAIDAFNGGKAKKLESVTEVTVVIPPDTEEIIAPKAIAVEDPKATKETEKTKRKEAVLVSGKPPKNEAQAAEPEEPEELAKDESKGLEVRVESIRSGKGKINPDEIQLKTSFPVKALGATPDGWTLNTSKQAPPFTRDVEIEPGVFVSLEITPHLLAPASDGINHFSVAEPGFDSQRGYQQLETVGSILGQSISKLDEDSMRMGNVLSDLHRLLASLPKPTETPEKP
jgi:hypothetical protein